MSSIKLDVIPKYKECAGRGCQNAGVHYLEIIFLDKGGWFCKPCRNNLIENDLVKKHVFGSGEHD